MLFLLTLVGTIYLNKYKTWVEQNQPITFKRCISVILPAGGGCASIPISRGGVSDLRRLILRTLNDNQLLILTNVASQERSLTSLLKELSEERGIPLSTLKLNARILRELNLISYGSTKVKKAAEVEKLGTFVLRLLGDDPVGAMIRFSD
jgi:hypothetical protein